MSENEKHIPVLLNQALEALQPQKGEWYIDATFGRGGHTAEILKLGAHVIAFDVDSEAIEFGQKAFAQEISAGKLILVRENFEKIAQFTGGKEISGVLFDFGTSSNQLKNQERGFSFEGNAELDMRMDDRLGVKAKDLLALLSEKQLTEVFITYGGEHEARKIAKEIVYQRQHQAIQTTHDLVQLINKVKRERRGHLNPATKVFQALRVIVNDELGSIERALPAALEVVKPGGRVATISFHEGEDRIAKHLFKKWETNGKGQQINREVITADQDELQENQRARSAKLRIFEKKS